ncbi:MAG TPA: hypothetical protein VE783_03575 [Candidatus Limnocylindrales bacterium]|nr:hypothetical protein [Candidatus Limnocylindrales bacterium]
MSFLLHFLLALQLALPPANVAPQNPFSGSDFAIRVTPVRATMAQGGKTTFDLFIDSSRPIVYSLKLDGIPPAVRPDIPKLLPGINTITLSCPADAPSGTYSIQATLLSNQSQQTQTFALEITPLREAPGQ